MNIKAKDVGEVVPEQGKQKLSLNTLSARGWDMQTLSYVELLTSFRKGLRNGNWRRLNFLDKALYRASLWYTKYLGSIVNSALVGKLMELVERLKETKGKKRFRSGFRKAVELLNKGEEIFAWAPQSQLKGLLKDPDYIFWLGKTR